ncbi:hypothetical protein [Streptosporangium minutum]|uniref:hypothetical protein n=1 Tax=Streptosporangium minutum TaxID=569862 RepID=UPI0013FD85EE|nr:hypothetical protein [Streptosporangium minutum]
MDGASKRFGGQLADYRTRARGSGEKILSDLRQAPARTPRQVSGQEARMTRSRYGLS